MSGPGGGPVRLPASLARAFALVLGDPLPTAVLIGAGTGELVRLLASRGSVVTVVGGSETPFEAARQGVDVSRVRYVVGEPGELLQHVAPASQDAIWLAEGIERLPTSELRWLLRACREAIAPTGACCLLTTERSCSEPRRKALTKQEGVSLFDIGALRALTAEFFASVDAFTWNGTERFEAPGYADELFVLARPGAPYTSAWLPAPSGRVAGAGRAAWFEAVLADGISMPPRFLLRASLHVRVAPGDLELQVLFPSDDPERFLWAGIRPHTLMANPAQLMLSSDSFGAVGGASWAQVRAMLVRARSRSQSECDVRISEVRILAA